MILLISACLLFIIPAILVLGVLAIGVSFVLAIISGLLQGFFDVTGKLIDKAGEEVQKDIRSRKK